MEQYCLSVTFSISQTILVVKEQKSCIGSNCVCMYSILTHYRFSIRLPLYHMHGVYITPVNSPSFRMLYAILVCNLHIFELTKSYYNMSFGSVWQRKALSQAYAVPSSRVCEQVYIYIYTTLYPLSQVYHHISGSTMLVSAETAPIEGMSRVYPRCLIDTVGIPQLPSHSYTIAQLVLVFLSKTLRETYFLI